MYRTEELLFSASMSKTEHIIAALWLTIRASRLELRLPESILTLWETMMLALTHYENVSLKPSKLTWADEVLPKVNGYMIPREL